MVEIDKRTYWKFSRLKDGGIHLVRKINIAGKLNIQDITGPFWIFGRIKLIRGTFNYKQGESFLVPPSSEWGFILPPFSIIQALGNDIELVGEMIIYENKLIDRDIVTPICFFDINNIFVTKEMRFSAKKAFSIERCLAPKPLAIRAKKLIDKYFDQPKNLSDIAIKLKTNSESISRAFKSRFHIV